MPGRAVHRVDLETTVSTMLDARRLVEAGEPLPLVVVAQEQTGARGRRGRSWAAPRGGVWLTFAKPVAGPDAACLTPRVGCLVCLAIERVIEGAIGVSSEPGPLRVKWPNDVMHGDQKVAGILCELVRGPSGGSVMLIGVGINANLDPVADLPGALRTPATSIRAFHGSDVDLELLTGRLIESLDALSERRGGDDPIAPQLQGRLYGVGQDVRVVVEGRPDVRGRIAGIDRHDGRLILDTAEGPVALDVGEVERLHRPMVHQQIA